MKFGSCKTCEHRKYHSQLDIIDWYCHGGPPSVVMLPLPSGDIGLKSVWPVTSDDELCGAYEVREDPPQRKLLETERKVVTP